MIRLSIPLEETIEKRNDFWIFTDSFSAVYKQDRAVFRKMDSWKNTTNYYVTIYYNFPFGFVPDFLEKLDDLCKNGVNTDVEHSFYEINIFPPNKIYECPLLNVQGIHASTNQYVLY